MIIKSMEDNELNSLTIKDELTEFSYNKADCKLDGHIARRLILSFICYNFFNILPPPLNKVQMGQCL
ncbi:MAG: hypothetical protein ACI81I_000950 [Arcobacteraceae bacterium]|jgi:hypothetical protein